jgi:hypothetical protein
MYRPLLLAAALLVGSSPALLAHRPAPVMKARTELRLPDVPGFVTLRCDLHMHTVFSDGLVWPTVRADEAWREGYDAIAITDHLEYQPHKADLPTNHNRAHDIARPLGESLGVLVVRGSEITRSMPPGHINAVFLQDSKALETPEWREAVAAAHQQGAFIFWNHPGWERQLIDGKVQWFPEHSELLGQGRLHGIEIANGRSYYPEAHRWALERKLAILGNSDVHQPTGMDYAHHAGDRRPVTLVFAAERTPAALKAALFARQTAVLAGGQLYGDERFVRPIVEGALVVKTPRLRVAPRGRVLLQVANVSDVDFELKRAGELAEVTAPATVVVPAGRTVLMELSAKVNAPTGRRTLALPWRVANVLPEPDRPLEIKLAVDLEFLGTGKKK